jgi:NagD protein
MDSLRNLKHLALDLDGTLYLGKTLFPFTLPFLARVRELGLGRTFFTNNSSTSTKGYVKKLQALGIDATADDIFSSTSSTLAHLRHDLPHVKKLFVLGTPALRGEFAENGFDVVGENGVTESSGAGDAPDAVVVGFDSTLDYERLCRAAWWISRGKPYLATNGDAVCPTDQPTLLVDCGSMCRMIAYATGRDPDAVLGKPDPRMLAGVMRRHDLKPDEIAVVGDRLYTDMAMAKAAGSLGILVLTGEATRQQAEAATAEAKPDLIVESVAELVELFTARMR